MLKIIPLMALLLCCGGMYAEQAVASALGSDSSLQAEHGSLADTITKLQQLLDQHPDQFQTWFLLGVTQAKQHRYHDAINSFNKVIVLQPQLAEPHNNLAVIYNELGDFRAAVKELEASLKLKPGYTTAQENIAYLYVKLATDAYRKALEHDNSPVLRQRYERLLHIRDVQHQDHSPDNTALQAEGENNALSSGSSPVNAPSSVSARIEKKLPENSKSRHHGSDSQAHAIVAAPASLAIVRHPLTTQQQQVVMEKAALKSTSAEKSSATGHVVDAHASIQSALAALESWRLAWSKQDLNAYFAAYDAEFDYGTRFKSREKWKHYKQWAIGKRSFIRVSLENIKVKPLPGGDLRLIFLQHFRSKSYNSDDIKRIELRQTEHGWKIIREISK